MTGQCLGVILMALWLAPAPIVWLHCMRHPLSHEDRMETATNAGVLAALFGPYVYIHFALCGLSWLVEKIPVDKSNDPNVG